MTLTGVMPVAPTVFADDEGLDLDGQRRVMDFLVDAGSAAVCVLANYSEQFSLDDAERARVAEVAIEQVADRIPVVVTTSHYSARIAARRSREAQALGARMVMLMPPFFGATMSSADDDVVRYFREVAEGLEIDIMIQDAPMSTTRLSVDLLARLADEVPQIRYAKIEVPRAAAKLRTLADGVPALPGLFDGEESVTLIPDLDAGAIGTMCSAMVPDLLVPVVRDHAEGDRSAAVAAWDRLLPAIHYENRQCGLQAAKIALAEGGVIRSSRCRSPLERLDAATTGGLIDLLRARDPLVLRWAA